jgi:hypothetical protein
VLAVFRVAVVLIPFGAGIVTAVPLWGDHAERVFFATAAEVIALGAVAMALQGNLFRVRGQGARSQGRVAMATVLIGVGVGLAFAFGALAREDGGSDAHLAIVAGALAMGISAFALQAFFGGPVSEDD